jgi:hypothetical protein
MTTATNLLSKARRSRSRTPDVQGAPTPAAVQVARSHVRVGDGYAATFAVVGYPAEVGPAWLDPLLSYPGRVDVAVYVEPVPAGLS